VQYAERLAGMKGQDIASGHSNAVVISADTIVVRDHEILGKPVNKDHALDMLLSLSGRWHEVITGFCILHLAQGLEYAQTISSQVYMPSCTREVLESYVATGEPMDKAGAYGIQGLGAFLVGEVRGSYTNVVGLPVREVLDALLAIKAIGVIDAQSLAPA
jgi:septum formation protein